MIRCLFVDHNGLQCRATTEQPTKDGWSDCEWRQGKIADLIKAKVDIIAPDFPAPSGLKDGWYCRAHTDALQQVLLEGGLDDPENDTA